MRQGAVDGPGGKARRHRCGQHERLDAVRKPSRRRQPHAGCPAVGGDDGLLDFQLVEQLNQRDGVAVEAQGRPTGAAISRPVRRHQAHPASQLFDHGRPVGGAARLAMQQNGDRPLTDIDRGQRHSPALSTAAGR